jgi:hypothetical protein
MDLENAEDGQSAYADQLAHSAIKGIGRSRWRKSVPQVLLDTWNDPSRLADIDRHSRQYLIAIGKRGVDYDIVRIGSSRYQVPGFVGDSFELGTKSV